MGNWDLQSLEIAMKGDSAYQAHRGAEAAIMRAEGVLARARGVYASSGRVVVKVGEVARLRQRVAELELQLELEANADPKPKPPKPSDRPPWIPSPGRPRPGRTCLPIGRSA